MKKQKSKNSLICSGEIEKENVANIKSDSPYTCTWSGIDEGLCRAVEIRQSDIEISKIVMDISFTSVTFIRLSYQGISTDLELWQTFGIWGLGQK